MKMNVLRLEHFEREGDLFFPSPFSPAVRRAPRFRADPLQGILKAA